ncbi:AAA family ATPase [Cryomorphaceae bacterium 1068]|nr:AAA family ATPase [Cryomorphaceae bacterium 1068]
MVKLNNIGVKGLRGVRNDLSIYLNGKSALLYGDNGSGKSSLSDVLDWFFYDRIDHLAGEEIGRKGYEALRNIFLNEEEPGTLELKFSKYQLDSAKTIELKNGSLKSTLSNDSDEFATYLRNSHEENLTLRYKELVTFVLSSKTDKLRALSEIIGYSKVTDTRDALRGVYNRLSKEIKTKGFDNLINHQQSQIIEQFGQNVTTAEQFIGVVNEIVEPFNLGIEIKVLKDINEVLKKIKKPDDSKVVKQEAFLLKIEESLVNLPTNLEEVETQYNDYKSKFDAIVSDIDKLRKLTIEQLLTTGKELVSKESYIENICPLCEQDKDKEALLNEIEARIAELEEIKKETKELNDANTSFQQQIRNTLRPLQSLLDDKLIGETGNSALKSNIETLIKAINKYQGSVKVKVGSESKLESEADLIVRRKPIDTLSSDCKAQLEEIKKSRKKDPKWEAYGKIYTASRAFAQILRLRKEKNAYEKQRDTLEVVYRRFLNKQKEALDAFLDNFSEKIDEIYQFLNPGEKVENIKLIPLEKNNELSGITIQFDFLDNKDVTPPHKFLSESHINCLGLAFFLTSVEAFNKENKFMILDDVISSFDANHRKRFADLLIEKYGDYQIILLTHEKTWFDIVKNLVRNKNWEVKTIKHNEVKGTYMDESPQSLRERIEKKISDRDEYGLGNDTRKYLEHLLKHIAFNLEVKVSYRFNDVNEDRMAFEMLTELTGTIAKRKCTELQTEPVIGRLLGSLFIGNKDSHDSTTDPSFGDMKAFWQDVLDFEKLFNCNVCSSPVSLRYYDEGAKQVSCKKGELTYNWKK